jgi:hypothetical protein
MGILMVGSSNVAASHGLEAIQCHVFHLSHTMNWVCFVTMFQGWPTVSFQEVKLVKNSINEQSYGRRRHGSSSQVAIQKQILRGMQGMLRSLVMAIWTQWQTA